MTSETSISSSLSVSRICTILAVWDSTGPMVLSIATGQFVIAIGMFLNRKLTRVAIVGAVVFGLAIAPLGVGSAFPCSVLLVISAVLLWNRGHEQRHKEQPD